jgi:hypothetical protein
VAMANASHKARRCGDGATGQARLRALFTTNGTVQRVDVLSSPPGTAECLIGNFQHLKIPAYKGKQRALTKTVPLE